MDEYTKAVKQIDDATKNAQVRCGKRESNAPEAALSLPETNALECQFTGMPTHFWSLLCLVTGACLVP